MNRHTLNIALIAALTGGLLLAGCGADTGDSAPPTETLAPRAWLETLNVDGEIQAAANTQLNVPGTGWRNRALTEMVADGSLVRKGQVIARFDAPQDRMELSQAETELLRKTLIENGMVSNAALDRADLSADRAKVDADLGLSQRYANADLALFARNQVLDALQDIGFLTNKRGYIGWKTGQVSGRSAADRALLVSQKDSISLTADQKRQSLAALDLLAPHDGVFILSTGWDGSKAQIGASLWSGQEFGSLPDLDKLTAHFSVPEGQAFGLKAGLPLRVRLSGTGTEISLTITKVGSSASAKSRESPVKYSDFDAAIEHDTALRLNLKPGQAISGTVTLIEKPAALTTPNVALVQDGAAFSIFTFEDGKRVKHAVSLGLRGPVRSEIKTGLAAGAAIVLLPELKEKKDAKTAKDADKKEKKS